MTLNIEELERVAKNATQGPVLPGTPHNIEYVDTFRPATVLRLLAIARVADEMRPYMNQFKGAAVDELKSRHDRLREREVLK